MSSQTNQFQAVIAISNSSGLEVRRQSDYSTSQKQFPSSQQPMFQTMLHGGFANRFLENNYNKSVFALLFLLQNTLLRFFDGEKCSQADFLTVFEKLFGRMLTLESQKYGPPKFTKSISKLVKFLGVNIDETVIESHEASIKRLQLKHELLQESREQQFHEVPDQLSRSLEPIRGRFEALESQSRPNRFKDDQQAADNRPLKDGMKQSGFLKRAMRKKSPAKTTAQPPQMKPQKSSPIRNAIQAGKKTRSPKHSPGRESKPISTDRSPGETVQTAPLQETPRDDDDMQRKPLMAHDSIHTIKEDDFTKEDDTQMEESKEMIRQSPHSPSHRLPHSKLDIPFSQIHSPIAPYEFVDHSGLRSLKQQIVEEEYDEGGPAQTSSAGNIRSLAYNDKTIKEKTQLDQILSQAKRQYAKDQNMKIQQANDYSDILPAVKKKRKLKPEVFKQNIKVENGETGVHKSTPIPFAKRSPPAIRTLRPRADARTGEKVHGQSVNKVNRSSNTIDYSSTAKAAKQIQEQSQQNPRRHFLRNLRRQRRENASVDKSQSSSQEDIDVLRQNILEQHLKNQQRIQEKKQAILAMSKQSSGSGAPENRSLARAQMRRFIDQKRQPNSSVDTSLDAGSSEAKTLQNRINRHRDKQNAVSLDEGFKLRRKLQPKTEFKSNNALPVHPRFKNINNLVYAQNNVSNHSMGTGGFEYFDDFNQVSQEMQDRNADSMGDGSMINHDLGDIVSQKRVSHSLVYNSQKHSSREREEEGHGNVWNSQPFPQETRNDDSMDAGETSERKNQILNLVPLPLKAVARNRAKHFTNQDYRNSDIYPPEFEGRGQVARKRDSAYESVPSSGRWRQPAGVASAGVSDGANTFSAITHKEAMSQMQPLRPGMMLNTLYSFDGRTKNREAPLNQPQEFSRNGVSQNEIVQIPAQRGQGHLLPDEIGLTEPSLPQFPPSSMDTVSLVQEQESPVRWKTVKSAARATRTKISFQGTNEQVSRRNTGLRNEQRSGKPHSSIMKNKRRMQQSQNEPEPYSTVAPLVKTQIQQRLHTRGNPSVITKNEDLGMPINVMNRTMQNWTKDRLKTMETHLQYADSENNPIIDPGVQEYIMSQQYKRKKVQTGYDGKNVSQNHSLTDNREIFSEEDFCNPEYHKFRLPAFSKAHHDSLFEIQKQRLQHQRQIFEEKAQERSSNQSIRSASRFGGTLPDDQKSGGVNNSSVLMAMSNQGGDNFYSRSGNLIPEPQSTAPYGKPIPTWGASNGSNQGARPARNGNDEQLTLENMNPLLEESQPVLQQPSNGMLLDMHKEAVGAYESFEEEEKKVIQEQAASGSKNIRDAKLSTQVAALIHDDDSDQEGLDGDLHDPSIDLFDKRSDDQNKVESSRIGGKRDNKESIRPSVLSHSRQHHADDTQELSAPDKELFEHSEQMNEDETPPVDVTEIYQRRDDGHTLFAVSPKVSKESVMGESQISQPPLQNNHSDEEMKETHDPTTGQEYAARLPQQPSRQSQGRQESEHSSSRMQRYKLKKLPENVIQSVITLDSKLKRQGINSRKDSPRDGRQRSSGPSTTINRREDVQDENNYVVYDEHQASNNNSFDQRNHPHLGAKNAISKQGVRRTRVLSSKRLPRKIHGKRSSILDKGHVKTHQQSHQRVSSQENARMELNQSSSQDANSSNERRVVYSIRRLSGSNRRSLQTNNSILPRSISNSNESRQRISKLSLDKRQRKPVP